MIRTMCIAAAAAIAVLTMPDDARAWGAAHVGYTHAGPAGVYHYGATGVRTPYGAYGGARAGAYGYGGAAYHTGYGGAYHYNTGYGAGYHYGAVGVGGYGYAGGVYRRY
ncbi:MAG TPA: hypothetical protein VLM40_12720 [Gemmata sp.]|nr:hypothetical protein [Gemmata sp.]